MQCVCIALKSYHSIVTTSLYHLFRESSKGYLQIQERRVDILNPRTTCCKYTQKTFEFAIQTCI